MAKLDKANFPENVQIYVDKTKTEILNSLSEILYDNDNLSDKLDKSLKDLEFTTKSLNDVDSKYIDKSNEVHHLKKSYDILYEDYIKLDKIKTLYIISLVINILFLCYLVFKIFM